jgi:hypothetical protein
MIILIGRLQPRVFVLDELRTLRSGARKHDTVEDSARHLPEVRQVSASPQTRASAQRPGVSVIKCLFFITD